MARTVSPTPPWAPIALLAAAAIGALLAGCAPPSRPARPAAELLYVGDGTEGIVRPLETQTGRAAGPTVPVPVGAAPTQIVAGPAGSLLVLAAPAAPPRGEDTLTHAVRSGSGWRTRPVGLGTPAYDARMAGDGGRYAVVAFHLEPLSGDGPQPSGPPCRVALIDIVAGVVERALAVCGPRERVTGVALESGPTGLVVYLGIWYAAEDSGVRGLVRGRVLALDATSGAVLSVAPLAGRPSHLAHAPGRSPHDARLYCVEHVDFLAYDTSTGTRSRLLALHPVTLQLERELTLHDTPLHVAVAPEGDRAYGLTSGGRSLVHVDLATGAESPLVSLPGEGYDLAAAEVLVYVAHPKGSAIWVVDQRRGTVARTIRVGKRPTWLALGSHASHSRRRRPDSGTDGPRPIGPGTLGFWRMRPRTARV